MIPLDQASCAHQGFPCEVHLHIKTRYPVTFFQPFGACSLSSRTSKAAPTLYISLARASIHIVLPFSTPVGISILYLWVTFLTHVLMAEMIASLFLRVYGTHQQNAGSSLIPLAIANSAISTGCDSFITESLVHDSVLSFHQARRSHLAVVFINLLWPFLVVMYLSSMLTATDSSFL